MYIIDILYIKDGFKILLNRKIQRSRYPHKVEINRVLNSESSDLRVALGL